jgi:hypothetical protein
MTQVALQQTSANDTFDNCRGMSTVVIVFLLVRALMSSDEARESDLSLAAVASTTIDEATVVSKLRLNKGLRDCGLAALFSKLWRSLKVMFQRAYV